MEYIPQIFPSQFVYMLFLRLFFGDLLQDLLKENEISVKSLTLSMVIEKALDLVVVKLHWHLAC